MTATDPVVPSCAADHKCPATFALLFTVLFVQALFFAMLGGLVLMWGMGAFGGWLLLMAAYLKKKTVR